jgi:hypothetical protein
MDRRAYITALGAALAAVSGCSDGDSTQTTGTPTGSPESTGQPSDQTPRVTDAGLLLDRGQYDDLQDDIEGVGQGGELIVGVEYDLPVSDGAARGLVEIRVVDDEDGEVAVRTAEIDRVVGDDSEFDSRQSYAVFDTTSWETGSYIAEVLVNDEGHGTTASTEVPVDVVEPLGAGEVELRLAEFPDEVLAGEPFDWTLGFRNLTDRDSSVVTDTVTIDPARKEPAELDIERRENVPVGEEILVEQEGLRFSHQGSYTYRIDELDAEFSFTIQPPE